MKLQTAIDIKTGKVSILDVEMSRGEELQLILGACLTDDGDIICLTCKLPNECCTC